MKSVDASKLDLPLFEERESLRNRVGDALRAALVAGEMRPGTLYSAPVLAAKFGVSATPVREAMLDLARQGLVETVRNKGFRVTELSDRDLDDITAVRALIEVPTLAEIARRCDERIVRAVEALRPLAREIVAQAERRDLIAYVEADRQFHLSLLALADNTHLVKVVADLRARSRLYGLQNLAPDRLHASALEHEQMVDLIAAGKADEVAEVMRRHIGHVRSTWAAPVHGRRTAKRTK